LPRLVDLVADSGIPVIAAGGIVDGGGYFAALALGAQGVCLGTMCLSVPCSFPSLLLTLQAFWEKMLTLNTPYHSGSWPLRKAFHILFISKCYLRLIALTIPMYLDVLDGLMLHTVCLKLPCMLSW
jgi:hypothetical protein